MNGGAPEKPAAGRHPAAGVPAGGIGTGAIEFGPDGRFRNITINNNRTAQERIALARHAFFAFRVQRGKEVWTRVAALPAPDGAPPPAAPLDGAMLAPGELEYRALYPSADYRVQVPEMPCVMHWLPTGLIIPYDIEASSLPVVFFTARFRNRSDEPLKVSALLNWENLSGCKRASYPAERGPIQGYALEPEAAGVDSEDAAENALAIGLQFGREEVRENADAAYVLAALHGEGQRTSVASWDPQDPDSVRNFWEHYEKKGELPGEFSASETAWCGAVATSCTVGPRATREMLFCLVWHAPRYVVNGADQGNAYTVLGVNAQEIAARAISHHQYFLKSVRAWQERISGSSLPSWLSAMLINSNSVLTTNSVFTQSGEFSLMESPAAPETGCLERRFHSSLSTLLFFPELQEREMGHIARTKDPDAPGRVYRYMGKESIAEPSHGDQPVELIDLGPKFILTAYRDFLMTGRRAPLVRLFPRLQEVIAHTASHDLDQDGLPEHGAKPDTSEEREVYDVRAYTSSLWIAALNAYILMAQALDKKDEAEKWERVLGKAIARFDEALWIDADQFYRLSYDTTANRHDSAQEISCHCGQLAGAWYAHFLCMGALFDEPRTRAALEAIARRNQVEGGAVREITSPGGMQAGPFYQFWPFYSMTHYGCLQLYAGNVEAGVAVAKAAQKLICREGNRTFCWPMGWDLDQHTAMAHGADRHVSAPAIWHVFFALLGFMFNAAKNILWLRPRLPEGIESLKAPIFTPICMGHLMYRESRRPKYQQNVRLEFDTPVTVKTFMLSVPKRIGRSAVTVRGGDGDQKFEHSFLPGEREQTLRITMNTPLMCQGAVVIRIDEY